MPPKKKPVKKPRQKQKQKQIVKTNVKVSVQSQGGSGGGGTPSFIPSSFTNRDGESSRLLSLVEQLSSSRARTLAEQPVRISAPIQAIPYNEPAYNPGNDAATINSVFNAPINTEKPRVFGGDDNYDISDIPESRRQYRGESDEAYASRMQDVDFKLAAKRGREKAMREKARLAGLPTAEAMVFEGSGGAADFFPLEEEASPRPPAEKKKGGGKKKTPEDQ
jgi:hypothetical protein